MKNINNLSKAEIRRQNAEKLLSDLNTDCSAGYTLQSSQATSEADQLKLIHELLVHQIELKLQNEELVDREKKAILDAEKYAELFDFAPSGYFILSREGKISQLNFSGAKILGAERSKLINSHFGFFVSNNTKPIFSQFLEKIFSGNGQVTCEVVMSTKSKEELHIYLSGTSNKEGESCLVTLLDITESKLNRELQRSNARFSSMIANISDVIAIMDADGLKKYESPNLEKFFGWLPEDNVGRTAFSYSHPDDIPNVQKVFSSLFEEDKSSKTFEFRFECKDGSYKPIEMTATNLLNEPHINGVMVNFHDITERKFAGETLLKSENRFRSMVSNISDVIGIMGADGIMTYKSPNIEQRFGWLPEERIGTSGFSTVHPDDLDHVGKVFYSLLEKENAVKTLEFRYLCKDGSYKPIELTAANLLHDPYVRGVLLNYRDITERKEAEEALCLSEASLRKLNAEKDKFFSIIAHDLRGPFSGFIGLTHLLAEQPMMYKPEKIQEFGIMMNKSASNLFRLLENLLEWSRMQRGLVDFRREDSKLLPIVIESCLILLESLKSKEIELIYDIPQGLNVSADLNMLMTVIRNLASNALKFTPRGGKITISAKPLESGIEIFVKDAGIGMEPDLIDRLFRLDAKAGRPGTEGEPSSGLGLLLCKDFINQHGGKIWVDSILGHGSVFTFTIPGPVIQEKEADEVTTSTNQDGPNQPPQLKILIVEDDIISSNFLSIAVGKYSKETIKVRSGKDAVQVCRDHHDIDLILMDIELPEMDGHEATRQIRLFNPNVIIIAQTVFAFSGQRELALEAGCNEYITKPVHKQVLTGLIEKHFPSLPQA
jgi:PAS domain S-box-containing protein